jgi:uncharacterized protein YbjT (DUF2867 family)
MKTNKKMMTVIVGGKGKTGRRVADGLAARGLRHRVASRSSDIPFDWTDESTWKAALEGADALYLTYFPDLAVPGAAEHVRALCDVAVSVGVEKIVLLSGRGEPQVHPAENAVRASEARHTILECAFFNQNFDEGVALPVDGKVTFPAGNVAEPFIDCDDIAACAVEALTNPAHDGKTYELTGPRLLTFREAVGEMASASGQPLAYVPVSFEQYADMLGEHVSAQEVAFFIELFRFLLDGHNAHTTDGVEQMLGRPARDFRNYAQDAAAAWR